MNFDMIVCKMSMHYICCAIWKRYIADLILHSLVRHIENYAIMYIRPFLV